MTKEKLITYLVRARHHFWKKGEGWQPGMWFPRVAKSPADAVHAEATMTYGFIPWDVTVSLVGKFDREDIWVYRVTRTHWTRAEGVGKEYEVKVFLP